MLSGPAGEFEGFLCELMLFAFLLQRLSHLPDFPWLLGALGFVVGQVVVLGFSVAAIGLDLVALYFWMLSPSGYP